MLLKMQPTQFYFNKIRNIGATLNLYIGSNICGHFWEKLESHGEITYMSDKNKLGLKG